MAYDPPRQTVPPPPRQALEIELVDNVRSCGTCEFFWPKTSPQPYGPYPAYDFKSNSPAETAPESETNSFVWLRGITRSPVFPNAEVMDGCRKAPIMTIGINPNLTAFAPGRTGASWCYPSFSNAAGSNSSEKYAYYYRYRSVFQEHFDLKFIEAFLLPNGEVRALKPGVMKALARTTDDPSYELRVQYDGEPEPSSIHLPGKLGEPRYVALINADEQFKKGDLLAARLNISPGHEVDVYAQAASYYLQMVPVLRSFEEFLRRHGHPGASLQLGEDVGQLDMVACASPHWGPPWLGGTNQSVNTIVRNCVHKNAWAMKQLVQSRPAIVFLVGQASWNMFRQSFGHLIHSSTPLPTLPEDGPYTLLRMTTQQEHRLEFSTTIGREKYLLSTRLVITPHFSYNENFFPQFRMSPQTFADLEKQFPAAAAFLQHDPRIIFQNPPGSFVSAAIARDVAAVLTELKQKSSTATTALMPAFYDPHQLMAEVLVNMYGKDLTFTDAKAGHSRYLTRSDGPCQFCVNERWKFPKGCPYGKPDEKQYTVGFLEQVVAALISSNNAATVAQPQ